MSHISDALAAGATLASGACMVAAGYAIHANDWGAGGLAMMVGGPLILLGYTVTLRARREGSPAVDDGRLSGAGKRGGGVGLLGRRAGPVAALSAASGAVMVLAGYVAAAWGWLLLIPLMLVGGLVILAAFALLVRC